MNSMIPIPRQAIDVRVATASDVAFIDRLQKMHSKMVGWMPTKQIEGKIAAGNVLIADLRMPIADLNSIANGHSQIANPVGYVISQDQYFKRDDLGIVYQLNVMPGHQRGLIGAMLIKTVFERAAYGCRLFCCWCAQDIEANRFWESLGFIPLAFRSGSRSKARTHIFWQRRIREGDVSTPFWFPAQTSAGSIREDRLVLPIPPGTHWCDVMPVVLPQGQKCLDEKNGSCKPTVPRKKAPPVKRMTALSGFSFGAAKPPSGGAPADAKPAERAKKPKLKNDPQHVAAARELRDRYLEHVNAQASAQALGKYAIGRGPLQMLCQDAARHVALLAEHRKSA